MKDIIKEKYRKDTLEIKCLDHGYVRLLDCMPRNIEDAEESADYTISEAARCSYQRGTKSIADDKTLIRYLMRHNHTSPFEMIEFKFKMKMPIFTARQFIRTRTANVNELSGRYSEMPEEYYVPDVTNIRMQSTINTQGSEGIMSEEVSDAVVEAIRDISSGDFDLYHDLLENGVVREQSRMVLPLSTYTEWYWKIDLKNLLHFLNLRCDSHAQQEIRVYGEAILNLIKPIVPWTIAAWEDYSPYRGGMMLSKYEVAKIQSMLKYVNMNNGEKFCPGRDIDDIGKLENREWVEKADKLGF